jgi:hypothetical protein
MSDELYCPFCSQTKMVLQKILDDPSLFSKEDIVNILSMAIKGLL